MPTILHVTTQAAWGAAGDAYRGDTLATQGFIHCSTVAQVVPVADALYHGQRDLILLIIETARVAPEIRYEDAGGGERYPHIYGPLNRDAVTAIIPFPPEPDGTFRLPDLHHT
jgi:uncharacterized protein (DUF952 family)